MSSVRLLFCATVILAGSLGACAAERSTDADSLDVAALINAQAQTPEERRAVAELRAATARFQRFDVAQAAGWNVQFPPDCFASDEGAMGMHYINESLMGSLDVAAPQLIMYEPTKNGRFELVGVEYAVPGQPDDEPPVLFNQTFDYNDVYGVWVLHVWAWKHNPAGIYAPWNPTVTCAYAPASNGAVHH